MKKPAIFLILLYILSHTLYTQTGEPILRINTPMHTALIGRIATDAPGEYILTCSDDKTAILWDGQTGEYIRTFRPPIDSGHEGKLYACALSPDGKTAAVGGWTGYKWDTEHSIYLFNLVTGEIINRVSGMENVIRDLEFSKDGKWLACCLGGAHGIRIIDIKTRAIHKKLAGYNDDSYN